MAYTQSVITAVTDIPALIIAFADDRGWTVAGSVITIPGGRSFDITASIGGTNNREHRVFFTDTLDGTRTVRTQMPWLNGVSGNPVVQTPTKLHLFGDTDPFPTNPWIGVVIECGYNLYRHMYIGLIDKIGNYTGGNIISANGAYQNFTGSGGTTQYNGEGNRYLFGARTSHQTRGVAGGGMDVVHADNANTYRRFDGPYGSNSNTTFLGNELFGGNSDNVNGGLVRRGVSDFAGSNILVPVNLFCSDSTNFGSDVRFRPLGRVPGVRMVDMRGLSPAESMDIGGDNWVVFPEFSKQIEEYLRAGTSRLDGGAGGFYPPVETSFNVGLAYFEGA